MRQVRYTMKHAGMITCVLFWVVLMTSCKVEKGKNSHWYIPDYPVYRQFLINFENGEYKFYRYFHFDSSFYQESYGHYDTVSFIKNRKESVLMLIDSIRFQPSFFIEMNKYSKRETDSVILNIDYQIGVNRRHFEIRLFVDKDTVYKGSPRVLKYSKGNQVIDRKNDTLCFVYYKWKRKVVAYSNKMILDDSTEYFITVRSTYRTPVGYPIYSSLDEDTAYIKKNRMVLKKWIEDTIPVSIELREVSSRYVKKRYRIKTYNDFIKNKGVTKEWFYE